jgi:DNA invertase Pin-like site-specific DNA recombinase
MHQKVTASHLKREAYLYVRQSTMHQVLENTESTQRQYALRERAVALGWPLERIVVVDSDLGQSGASAQGRQGFQRLVAEVGLGHVGIVLGLEVSRLARSSSDWHQLLEICAMTDTLILDEDGIYDPAQFNDRLLLGLKGTMSEAELHVLRARMRGGLINKARRGELKTPLPIGFVYGPGDRVVLDPDQQVQQAVRLLFECFRRSGSASRTVREFREQSLPFPRRMRRGPHKGELVWGPLLHSTVLHTLHNPRYAGVFFFGRTRWHKTVSGGHHIDQIPPDQWLACIRDAHPGYISWEQYEDNLRRLRANDRAYGSDRRRSPAREGPALLQGLVICGRCGGRMTIRYHQRRDGRSVPDYVCMRDRIERGAPVCQVISGAGLDDAIGNLLVEAVTPLALEVALTVQQELTARTEQADRLRRQQVERARYEADLAQRRYLQVDPNNRLVADVLEADWNAKLREVAAAQETYERQRQQDRLVLDDQRRAEILGLATDFPRLWLDPHTTDRDRKRMVQLILEDVTLIRTDRVTAAVRFKGGVSRTITVPLPLPSWQLRKTEAEVIQLVDRLLETHTDGEVAVALNERGFRLHSGTPFAARDVQRVRKTYHVPDRFNRLRARGLLTVDETAEALGVCRTTVLRWRRAGLLRAYAYDDRDDYLYEPPGQDAPARFKRKAASRAGSSPRGR